MSIQCQSSDNSSLSQSQSSFNPSPICPQSDANRANPFPILRLSDVKQGPILCQSSSNLTSIQCQFCQSIANSTLIQCRSIPILFQYNVNPMPIWCQSGAKLMPMHPYPAGTNPVPILPNLMPVPMPIQRQSCAHQASTYLNLMSIWCRSSANLMPIRYKSDVNQTPIHPNPIPILYQSDANPTPNLPFQCRSWTNSSPIWQSITKLPIHHQSANPMLIHHQSANLMAILDQSINPLLRQINEYDRLSILCLNHKKWIDTGLTCIGTDHANTLPIRGHLYM